jgi:putative methylase
MNKKQVAIQLSKLKQIEKPIVSLEQYQTESEIAAEALWFAYMNEDIENKIVADLGCGNGILGIAALILGAKKVYFVEIDNSSLVTAKQNTNNLKLKNAVFIRSSVENFNEKVDTVIQNPPFGVQREHADKPFLEKAMQLANSVYSFHKIESKEFINNLTRDTNFKVIKILKFKFPIKKTLFFHKKKAYLVDVGCWLLKRNI